MKRAVTVLIFLGAAWGTTLEAQVPAGGEFQINTYSTGSQWYPSVASDASGGFVVAWYRQDGFDPIGVFAARFGGDGAPVGAEFQVGAPTRGPEIPTTGVACDAAGNFVVIWPSWGQDGDGWGVFARRYDASGVPRGGEFQVNSYTTGNQSGFSVASDEAGNFVVVWQGVPDGDGSGVSGQRFSADGTPRGGEFQVNSYTTGGQGGASVSSNAAGDFVVAWSGGQDGSGSGLVGQRFDASGARRGSEFRINTYTTHDQGGPSVALDAAGNFVVTWTSYGQVEPPTGGPPLHIFYDVFAQRYDAAGARRGGEFLVNTYTRGLQTGASVTADAAGSFVVTWTSGAQDGYWDGVFAQRYDAFGTRRGGEFQVNTYTTDEQWSAGVAGDAVGNFVAIWTKASHQGTDPDVMGQRYGGLHPTELAVDAAVSGGSDGNGVIEPGEASVEVRPSWHNTNGAAQDIDGGVLSFDGPWAEGVSYELQQAVARYGVVPDGATTTCTDCFRVGVHMSLARPATHWDATLTERLTPDALGQTMPWPIHVGESFTDVPRTSPYYRFVETLLHKGVTGGCSASSYCPASATTREQMAVFALVGKEGARFAPPACATPVFGDVPASSPYCPFIEELARRGVVSGCGGGNYCPDSAVTREQMPVFVLRLLDPLLDPPACGSPVFGDVPASSPFCRWIEELARRGIVGGCGGGNYCPAGPVTREQMAVFVAATFGLGLYGP